MPNVIPPGPGAEKQRYAVVVAEWNKAVTGRLLEGAVGALHAAGVADDAIEVAWVPGAWELPVVVQRLADTCRYAAILALGAVVKGDTSHDYWINHGVSDALMRIGVEHSLPVLFGVLTCDSLEQALQRAGGAESNKGVECAQAALAMVGLLRGLPTK